VSLERLILSVGAILLAARALGWAFQRIGQPHVVGEMTAGIVLGPSLLGRLFPATFAYLFRSGRHESPKGGNVISNVTETGDAGLRTWSQYDRRHWHWAMLPVAGEG